MITYMRTASGDLAVYVENRRVGTITREVIGDGFEYVRASDGFAEIRASTEEAIREVLEAMPPNPGERIQMTERRKIWGWYSARQAAHFKDSRRFLLADECRCCIYEDANGNEVVITEITEKPKPPRSWGDYQSLGELKRFLRFVKAED